MALVFTDQMKRVFLGLVVVMLENHRQHRAPDKASEEHHDGDGSQTRLDEQRVESEHYQDGRVFVEVLNGNRASGAHEDMAAVLQQSVHRNNEETGHHAHAD